MRSLIPYSLLLLSLVPACGDKHSLGELLVGGSDESATSSDPVTDSASDTGDPPPVITSTGDEPVTTTAPLDDPCTLHDNDEAACLAAECSYVAGGEVIADDNGCRFGGGIGFCVRETGGADSPQMFRTPDDKVYVFSFDPIDTLPDDWTGCNCGAGPDALLACACVGFTISSLSCGEAMQDHCDTLTDEDSCNQFQGDDGLHGCAWFKTEEVSPGDMACNGGEVVDRCVAVELRRPDDGCPSTQPPPSCDPETAEQRPVWARVDGELLSDKIQLIHDMPCEFGPLGEYNACWDSDDSPALCECPCL